MGLKNLVISPVVVPTDLRSNFLFFLSQNDVDANIKVLVLKDIDYQESKHVFKNDKSVIYVSEKEITELTLYPDLIDNDISSQAMLKAYLTMANALDEVGAVNYAKRAALFLKLMSFIYNSKKQKNSSLFEFIKGFVEEDVSKQEKTLEDIAKEDNVPSNLKKLAQVLAHKPEGITSMWDFLGTIHILRNRNKNASRLEGWWRKSNITLILNQSELVKASYSLFFYTFVSYLFNQKGNIFKKVIMSIDAGMPEKLLQNIDFKNIDVNLAVNLPGYPTIGGYLPAEANKVFLSCQAPQAVSYFVGWLARSNPEFAETCSIDQINYYLNNLPLNVGINSYISVDSTNDNTKEKESGLIFFYKSKKDNTFIKSSSAIFQKAILKRNKHHIEASDSKLEPSQLVDAINRTLVSNLEKIKEVIDRNSKSSSYTTKLVQASGNSLIEIKKILDNLEEKLSNKSERENNTFSTISSSLEKASVSSNKLNQSLKEVSEKIASMESKIEQITNVNTESNSSRLIEQLDDISSSITELKNIILERKKESITENALWNDEDMDAVTNNFTDLFEKNNDES